MRFDLVSIFPEMLVGPLRFGVIGQAQARGRIAVEAHDLRDFADPPHRSVDDEPYGGGAGMVFRLEPLRRALTALRRPRTRSAVIGLSPAGQRFDQAVARELTEYDQLLVLCDRYEGVDARLRPELSYELSIGDYVLTGAELAVLVLVDAVARLVPGVVGDAESVREDSFSHGLLDYAHYTRPSRFESHAIPAVLASGDHGKINQWRRREAVRRTLERRPDLLDGAPLRADVDDLVMMERQLNYERS